VGQQFHQVSDLDGFERTHGALDLAAKARVEAAGDELVELLNRVFPCEGVGSEARVVLDLMLAPLPGTGVGDQCIRVSVHDSATPAGCSLTRLAFNTSSYK
jgi:hypothetical protein